MSCRDVFRAEIPHYFRHAYGSGDRSVAPQVEYASELDGPDPRCVVSIIGCTGDWTGGWDASRPGEVDRFITADLSQGRMVEVIERGEPAIMVCHWTGIYFNGGEEGFQDVPGGRSPPACQVRPPALDEAGRDRPLLGRERAHSH